VLDGLVAYHDTLSGVIRLQTNPISRIEQPRVTRIGAADVGRSPRRRISPSPADERDLL